MNALSLYPAAPVALFLLYFFFLLALYCNKPSKSRQQKLCLILVFKSSYATTSIGSFYRIKYKGLFIFQGFKELKFGVKCCVCGVRLSKIGVGLFKTRQGGIVGRIREPVAPWSLGSVQLEPCPDFIPPPKHIYFHFHNQPHRKLHRNILLWGCVPAHSTM